MLRWLVNVGLLGLPIAVTLGILVGLQSQSDEPLFKPPAGEGGGKKGDNSLKQYFECNRTAGIHPPTDGQGYTCKCHVLSYNLPGGILLLGSMPTHRCRLLEPYSATHYLDTILS